MTGPSLTSSTCMSARKAGGDPGAQGLELGDDLIDQGLGVLGAGGGDPGRAPPPAGVAVERELADHQDLAPGVGH